MSSSAAPSFPSAVGSSTAPVIQVRRFGTRVLVPSEATNGQYSLLEHTLEPGCVALPMHRHARETKTFYGLSGRLRVRIEATDHDLTPGVSLTVPAGTWHTIWNPRPVDPAERDGLGAGERASYLTVVAPGGLEALYAEAAATLRGSNDPVPDIARVIAISAAHGMEVRMESLLDFVERERVSLA